MKLWWLNTFAFAEWQKKKKLSANHWSQMKFKCRTLVKANINSSDRKKVTKKMYALLKIVRVGKPYGKSHNFGKGKMLRYLLSYKNKIVNIFKTIWIY